MLQPSPSSTAINPAQIHRNMRVFSSHGEPLGAIDHIDGGNLELVRDEVGQHHFIPMRWIDRIDEAVHLTRPAEDLRRLWAGERFE